MIIKNSQIVISHAIVEKQQSIIEYTEISSSVNIKATLKPQSVDLETFF